MITASQLKSVKKVRLPIWVNRVILVVGRLSAQVSNSANTPSIFFDDQTRQLGAAHADLSLVGLNRREPIEPRVGRQIVGVRTASDARHRRRVK
jgi:hypothetical protein